ncbi:MAG: carboxypeptidase-like regulatory domain-containing protein [Fibrobacter sp.]|jgi:hypothetical protein|nr:carboxypeptidase-like regulatory domain-containing protein [Fibrobacter sp.]
MKFVFFLSILLLFLAACENSDNVLFQDPGQESLRMEAAVIRLADPAEQQRNADTLLLNDSVFFTATIYPSKSVPLKSFYWTYNGIRLGNEFSFKTVFRELGLHLVSFTIVDIFGDSLSDTIRVRVTQKPILDSLILPRDSTQGVHSQNGVSFVWNLKESDPGAKVFYRFKLFDSKNTYADTLLENPFYFYPGELSDYQKIMWSVQAINEFQVASEHTISAVFYTGSAADGGVTGTVYTPIAAAMRDLTFELRDSNSQKVSFASQTQLDSLLEEGFLHLSPLAAGNYTLVISNKLYADYRSSEIPVRIASGEVLDIGTILLVDSAPPLILSLDSDSLLLPPLDTLTFLIQDQGLPRTAENFSLLLNGIEFTDSQFRQDTLHVFSRSYRHSFTEQILTIRFSDGFYQNQEKTFYLAPFPPADEGENP